MPDEETERCELCGRRSSLGVNERHKGLTEVRRKDYPGDKMSETYIDYDCTSCGAEWTRTIDRGLGGNSDVLGPRMRHG